MPWVNTGESEALEAIISRKAMVLGLYKNVVVPTDGSLTMASLTEMPTGGGRGYAPIALPRTIVFDALALNKWYLSLNSSGKMQAQFSNVAQQVMLATSVDVADANTITGMFIYCWKIPFVSGSVQIKEGDIIKGVTSAATAAITGVLVISGSWAAGTAAGYLYLEAKTGVFQNGENLSILGALATASIDSGGTSYSGYAVGDIIQVPSPNATYGRPAILVVTAVSNGAGAVTGFVVVDPGQGFTVDTGLDTKKITGSGDDSFTVDVSALSTAAHAVSASATLFSGDAWKELMFLNAMTTPVQITQVGFPITSTPIISGGNDTAVS